MKRKTREQRRRELIANVWRAAVLILLLMLMCAAFCCKVQSVEPVTADDYLASIGADNATRAELKTVWESWED